MKVKTSFMNVTNLSKLKKKLIIQAMSYKWDKKLMICTTWTIPQMFNTCNNQNSSTKNEIPKDTCQQQSSKNILLQNYCNDREHKGSTTFFHHSNNKKQQSLNKNNIYSSYNKFWALKDWTTRGKRKIQKETRKAMPLK